MADHSPTVLIVETTAGDPPIEFLGDSGDIVYFISMAHSERYGADHPLAKAASIIKRKLRISMGPLLNFGDAAIENAAEEEMLERLWQEPQPLADAARQVASAVEDEEEVRDLTSALPELPERLKELAEMADWALAQGARVRITFVL
ncbi:MAG TPA: hypothetical protein VMR52_08880 [Dehalococcoidia bacterium]|nr:hypothetical protein [Dehalococcoidia bacterium]